MKGDRIDKEAIRGAYNDVRSDSSDTTWAAFEYEGERIVFSGKGTEFEEFKKLCTVKSRLYGFLRFETGDTMSKRAKFALITWIGEEVGGLHRAKISTDKALVKDIVQNFAKEFMMSDPRELDEESIRTDVIKAGGANYDAQAE